MSNYTCPSPIVDQKEQESLDKLTAKYNRLIEPSKLAKIGHKVSKIVPAKIKAASTALGETITEQELYQQALELISSGFKTIEEQVSKHTINETAILKKLSNVSKLNDISTLDEICLLRSYDIAKIVNKSKGWNRFYAFAEGGSTGFFGFAGLPANLVVSLLLYFRAVQTIAMYYGYDVKNDDEELIIASEVFTSALSPGKKDVNNEMGSLISKVMIMSEASVIKQTAKKTWTDMATRGGVALLITQMRALANKAAKKALEKAGKKGLEQSLFKNAFEQIGRKLTLKFVGKAVPIASSVLGALIDVNQMNSVVKYADIFYQKRFIAEKEERVNLLLNGSSVIDIEFVTA